MAGWFSIEDIYTCRPFRASDVGAPRASGVCEARLYQKRKPEGMQRPMRDCMMVSLYPLWPLPFFSLLG